MRTLLAVLTLAVVACPATADDAKDKKDKSKKPAITLKVGDPAPELSVSKWLQGDEVTKFEKDKVYVVEVWATWCGPCVVMMPHLAELQAEYKSKGVTFIGYSTKTQEPEEKNGAFVKRRGQKLGYTFAYGDSSDAWMKASGQGGIPCSFVVDKASKIAYIGHPVFLDIVLPKVVDGTWNAEAGAEEIKRIDKEFDEVFGLFQKKPADGLTALEAFEKKNPALKDIPYFTGPRLGAMLKAGKAAEAKELAEAVVKKASKYDDTAALRTVSATLRTDGKDNKDLMALALKAAEGMLECAGDKDPLALVNLASTYFAAGDKAKAKEYGAKAAEAAAKESPQLKAFVEREVKKFED